MWKKHLNQWPTSDNNAAYGTPEMAYSLQRLILKENNASSVIIMGGHEEGILLFAPDVKQAAENALSLI